MSFAVKFSPAFPPIVPLVPEIDFINANFLVYVFIRKL
jgi:hypothetical protein